MSPSGKCEFPPDVDQLLEVSVPRPPRTPARPAVHLKDALPQAPRTWQDSGDGCSVP